MIIGYCAEVLILLVFSVGKTPPEGSSILIVSHHCARRAGPSGRARGEGPGDERCDE